MHRKTFLWTLASASTALSLGYSKANGPDADDSTPGLNHLKEANWDAIRSIFPLRDDRMYLNTGGLGPASTPVLDTVANQNQKQAISGEHFHSQLKAAHKTLSECFGGSPEEYALTRNASEANSIIAAGIELSPGDEIILDAHAHPGGAFAWLNRQKRDGAKVRIFEPSPISQEENLNRIFELANERTKVIQVSHITATTGLLFDAPAIAREARKRGIWFHIDGAQSAGMIPFDLRDIDCDSFGTSGHKWMNGPIESGFLYIKKSRNHDIACSHIGAYSNDEYSLPDTLTYLDTAQRHEYGTRNAATALGLAKAIEIQRSIGPKRIADHGQTLTTSAARMLSEIPQLEILTPSDPSMRNSILTFRVPGLDCIAIYKELLSRYNIRTRVVTERDLNAVRASWHVYHQEADTERYAQAVKETIARLG